MVHAVSFNILKSDEIPPTLHAEAYFYKRHQFESPIPWCLEI